MAEVCQSCGHKCIAVATAKCSDMFHFRWPGGREQKGSVLPNELIGLRANGADKDYIEIEYCLVCGQIQGTWPVKGAAKYLREFAPKRVWEAYTMWEDGTWSTTFFYSTTKEKIEEDIRNSPRFQGCVAFKIFDMTGQHSDISIARDLG